MAKGANSTIADKCMMIKKSGNLQKTIQAINIIKVKVITLGE